MLSILLGHSYFLRFDRKQFERAKPYPPLATLQTAALLRQAGHQVVIFDAMLAEGTGEYEQLLREVQPQLVLLYEDNFNYLSKMCLGKMRQAACEMLASARRTGCAVIAAGSDASDTPKPYLTAGADVVLVGEGLTTLLALLDRLDENPQARLDQLTGRLSGIASLVDDEVRITSGASLMPTPLQPALPAWDLIDIGRYRAVWQRAHGYFSMNMAASRGCSFRCNWCAKPIWGNQYLQRNAAEVAAEMAHLKRTFQPDHIWFADDIFGFRVDWVTEFAASARVADGIVPFTIQTRADLISQRMAQALKEAGCCEAWIGAESGSQRILDAMNKGTSVEEIFTARERFRDSGIKVGFFIQLGYLDEQLDDILSTRDLIERSRPDDVGISVSYPLPGTKFYETVKAQLVGKTRWNESNDLEMMFHGTYRSDFYRAVRDLLHDEVSAWKIDAKRTSAEYRRVRSELQQRWNLLLASERYYRTDPAASVEAVRA